MRLIIALDELMVESRCDRDLWLTRMVNNSQTHGGFEEEVMGGGAE